MKSGSTCTPLFRESGGHGRVPTASLTSHDTYEGYVIAPATGGAGVQPDCAEVDTVVVGSEVALAGRGVSSSATYYDADPV
jgi:hypothetical protein